MESIRALIKLWPLLLIGSIVIGCDSGAVEAENLTYILNEVGDDNSVSQVVNLSLPQEDIIHIDSSFYRVFNIESDVLTIKVRIEETEPWFSEQDYIERVAMLLFLVGLEGQETHVAGLPMEFWEYQDGSSWNLTVDCGIERRCRGVLRTMVLSSPDIYYWIEPTSDISIEFEADRRVIDSFTFSARDYTFEVPAATAVRSDFRFGEVPKSDDWKNVFSRVENPQPDVLVLPHIVTQVDYNLLDPFYRFFSTSYNPIPISEVGFLGSRENPWIVAFDFESLHHLSVVGIRIPE